MGDMSLSAICVTLVNNLSSLSLSFLMYKSNNSACLGSIQMEAALPGVYYVNGKQIISIFSLILTHSSIREM